MQRASMMLLAGWLLSGCYSAMQQARPDQPPGDDEVVLVGEIDFDPAITPPGSPPGVINTYDQFTKYLIAFGDSPDVPVKFDSMSGIDRFAMVTPGQPFAIVAPRHVSYVRMLRTNSDYKDTPTWGGRELTMYVVACTGALQIPIQPKDRYVYLGHLICKHGDGHSAFEVDGSMNGVSAWLPRLVGNHKLISRIPTIVTATAANE